MNNNGASNRGRKVSRRDFIKTSASAAVSLAAVTSGPGRILYAASDELRIGLIGCGGRGTGAVTQVLLATNTPVKLWAMGDLFRDQLDKSYDMLSKGAEASYDRVTFSSLSAKMDVPKKRKFVGFDAYRGVIDSGVDIVILATTPHYRPEHFKYAVEKGKHVFMEKPVAVDPVGVRSVIASAELAKKKKLSIVAGTQRRHQNHYLEIMRRIHGGDIGEIVGGQCYWNSGGMLDWGPKDQPGWTEMERQNRRWYFYTWLCGDHIVEQHVHNLDVINWALGTHPVKVMGMGGRQYRTGKEYGNIWDHFAVEYEYPGGVRIMGTCRHTDGASHRNSERLVGTKGSTYTDGSNGSIEGQNAYKYDGPANNPYVQEHKDLIESIRSGKPINEGRQVAESTLTAIMGRMSAYTGRELSWDWAINASKLDLRPPKYDLSLDDLPVRPVAIPGKTKLI